MPYPETAHNPKARAMAHFIAARSAIAQASHSLRFGIKELGAQGPEAKAAGEVLKHLAKPFGKLFRLIEKMEKEKKPDADNQTLR